MDHTTTVHRAREASLAGAAEGSAFERLDRPARTALLVAALAEECDQWSLVRATDAALGAPVALDVLDAVVVGGWAAVEAGRVRVPRDDVRRTVISAALPSERQAVHEALADVVQHDPLASAWHLTHARQDRDTEAAEVALTTGRSLQRMGRPRRAREMLEHAARLSTSAAPRAACLLEAGATAFALGLPGEAGKLVDRAEATGLDADLAALPALLRATFVDAAPRSPARPVEVAGAVRRFDAWGLTSLSFSVLVTTGIGAVSRGASPQAGAAADRAALAALASGDLPEASRLLAEECPRLATAGLRGVETHARAVLAQTAARRGDLRTAAHEVSAARELARATKQPVWATHAAMTAATIAAMRGEADGAQGLREVERTVLVGEHPLGPPVELAHAVALLGADQWWDAYPVLVGLATRSAHCPELLTAGLLGYLAEAALHTGQVVPARELVSRTASASPACSRGAELADLLYATAVLATERKAESCFEVLRSLDSGRWPWVRARGDLALGSWLRRDRRVSQARPHLLSAQRLFSALDAPVWQRRVRTELRAAGVHTADNAPLPRGHDEMARRLSPQELEIVRLAAQGLSNRQIGDRLFLSPRTIGSHLYRIFPKLDVTSRRQLVGLVSPGGA